MDKQSMYNEFEVMTPQSKEDFIDIESYIKDCVRSVSEKYKTIDIEHHLQQLVSTICSETRLRNSMELKLKLKDIQKQEKYNSCNHNIVWVSDGITAFGGKFECMHCGYLDSVVDGR